MDKYAKYALWAGAAGLLTGMGGKYFFVIPVATIATVDPSNPTSYWGQAVWTKNSPGSMPSPQTWDFNDFLRSSLSIMLDLPSGWLVPNGYWGDPMGRAFTFYENDTNWTPGPLGERGGWIFVLLLAYGLIKKYY